MSRSFLAAAVAATTILLLPAPASASARMCSNTPGGDVVSATNTTCREAHKLIRLWLAGFRRDGRTDRNVAKWTCRNRPNAYEGDVMHCSKGARQRVRWYVNIPR